MVLVLKYLNETTFYYLSADTADTAKVRGGGDIKMLLAIYKLW